MQCCLRPAPGELLRVSPVGWRVGSPHSSGWELLERIAAQTPYHCHDSPMTRCEPGDTNGPRA
jgi:hypothetical protein